MAMQPIDQRAQGVTLDDQMRYAQNLADSNLLPAHYRKNPANVLLAVQLGEALRIPTIQAINSIHVIEGKPSAGAELLASVVRRAGHKLRVVEEPGPVVTATLVRADDPDFAFLARWDTDKARQAGLLGKDNWKKYPGQMMRNRAITEVCRMGASDAMYGVSYDPEELETLPRSGAGAAQVVESSRDWWADADAAGSVDELQRVWTEAHRHGQLTPELRTHMQALKAAMLVAPTERAASGARPAQARRTTEPTPEPAPEEPVIVDAEVIDPDTGEILATPADPAPSPAKRVTLTAIIRELERCGVDKGTVDAWLPVFGIPRDRLADLAQEEAVDLLGAVRSLDRDRLAALGAEYRQEAQS